MVAQNVAFNLGSRSSGLPQIAMSALADVVRRRESGKKTWNGYEGRYKRGKR